MGCNGKKEIEFPVYSITNVYIPDGQFSCMDRPTKPVKVTKPDGSLGYRDSDVGKLINDYDASDADCRNQLQTVAEIYKRQSSEPLKEKPLK